MFLSFTVNNSFLSSSLFIINILFFFLNFSFFLFLRFLSLILIFLVVEDVTEITEPKKSVIRGTRNPPNPKGKTDEIGSSYFTRGLSRFSILDPKSGLTDPISTPTCNIVAQPQTSNTMDSQAVKDPSQFGFTWRIDRFSKMNAKNLYSDVFEVGGYKWRGLIFPKGNNVDYLSMYLDVANSASLPNGWSRYAKFSLTVVNQINNKDSVRKGTHHKFNKEQSDWGFTSFIPLGELFDTSKGYLVNDTLVVKVEVTISVDVKDTAEHLRERLKKEQEEEKHRNKEKPEAHLYTIIKVVLEEDLAKQIGKDIYFDLVDFDQVRSFRVEKKTPVNLFKEEVAKEFGIPAQFQCFWLWAKRQNHTCRPLRPLTDIENTLSVEQLRLNDKFSKKELKLFLVVERGLVTFIL